MIMNIYGLAFFNFLVCMHTSTSSSNRYYDTMRKSKALTVINTKKRVKKVTI